MWKVNESGLGQDGDYRLNFHGGITGTEDRLPSRHALVDIYPNPFNPRTNVAFRLARETNVTLELYDMRGAKVRSVSLGSLAAGPHDYALSGVDQRGAALASGRYVVQLIIGEERHRRSITLIK